MRWIKVCLVLIVILGLTACSGRPDNDLIEQSIIAEHESDFLTISDIERLNGYEEGDNKYIVEVQYTSTFTKSYEDVAANATGFERMALGLLTMMVGEWDKGDSFTEQTTLTFVDGENGWTRI